MNRNNMDNSTRGRIIATILMAIIIIIALIVIGHNDSKKYEEIKYSEAQEMLINGEIKKVEIFPLTNYAYLYSDGEESSYKTRIPNVEAMYTFLDNQNKNGVKIEYEVIQKEESFSFTSFLNFFNIILSITLIVFIYKRFINPTGDKNIENAHSDRTFNDVAGISQELNEVQEIVDFLHNPKRFKSLGARSPKGVLLVGEPGTGKTLIAKAMAGEANCNFYQCTGSDFENMYVGVGASKVRKIFDTAKRNAPSIIFIDEIDSIATRRYTGRSYSEQTLNQLLGEMDGFVENTNVVVIAATNHLEVLDPAITRAGRFDRIINIPSPDLIAREQIIAVHIRNKKFNPIDIPVIIKLLAEKTSGMVGADLENIINESAIIAVRNNHSTISIEDVNEAFIKQVLGVSKGDTEITNDEKVLTAIHEAGHAITSRIKRPDRNVLEISIIPRGRAGGYTLFSDTKKKLPTKEDLVSDIIVSLGGRAAEEVFFKEISIGASSDLEKATKIAHTMIYRYAMSNGNQLVKLMGESSYNEILEEKMISEVEALLQSSYEKALEIIKANEELIKEISLLLLKNSTISPFEFDQLCKTYNI